MLLKWTTSDLLQSGRTKSGACARSFRSSLVAKNDSLVQLQTFGVERHLTLALDFGLSQQSKDCNKAAVPDEQSRSIGGPEERGHFAWK